MPTRGSFGLDLVRAADSYRLRIAGIQEIVGRMTAFGPLNRDLSQLGDHLGKEARTIMGPAVRAMELAASPLALHSLKSLNVRMGSALVDAAARVADAIALGKLPTTVLQGAAVNQIKLLLQDPALRSMPAILRSTVLAQATLARVDLSSIGGVLGVSPSLSETLSLSVDSFLLSYARLNETLLSCSISRFPLSRMQELPAGCLFSEADALNAVSAGESDDELERERDLVRKELRDERTACLPKLLAQLDPDLPRLLEGSNAALMSEGPDRIRHHAISLRELLTHVVHKLAPDAEVRSWTSDPAHFANGRPTRRARLLYIAHGCDSPALHDFIERDVDASLALLDVYQQGTHAVTSDLPVKLWWILQQRMSLTLTLLMQVASRHSEAEEDQ